MAVFRALVLMTVLASLTGCSYFEVQPSTTQKPNTALAVKLPPRKPLPPTRDKTPAPLPDQGRRLPPPLLDPAKLVGLRESQVSAYLGRPGTVRQEGPATVWRYSVSQCWVDVFFFSDLATGNRQVLTYEIETERLGEQQGAPGRCLQLIQNEFERKS